MRRFKNILCVLSRRNHSHTMERAVSLAETNQARLRVVAVVDRVSVGMGMPDGGPVSAQLQAALIREGEERVQATIEAFGGRVDMDPGTLVGTTFLEVIHEVLHHDHDLVIKAAEDPDWLDRLFGSDDMHLLRKCPCPGWLLNPGAPKRFANVLAAVDLDDAQPERELEVRAALNDLVLQLAASLAMGNHATLHVGHAWEATGESTLRGGLIRAPEAQVDRYVEQVRETRRDAMDRLLHRTSGVVDPEVARLQKHLVKGTPRKVIPALARDIDADLLVMGTVARTGIPGFIVGNTAEMILSQIGCSVMAVKPPGFLSPVELPVVPNS